ncbi:hypothetical protein BV22DRAFT_1132983 [Leucogyrophana mollusca]|uniref:Uncharacterized protein n=1 Tax=Leucogyrophana mollusca TaxID=85980 RepID=A0ACB8B5N1_9AGAM|nr:hypothetical protein BV22DRAFT_1132983 [Leucogyrophana mollusca]
MRLPSYRSSHLLRYHPYPRYALSQHERLTQISDDRCDADQENTGVLWPSIQERDEETAGLGEALRPAENAEGEQLPLRCSIPMLIIVCLYPPPPSLLLSPLLSSPLRHFVSTVHL